jgi:hypothetical protein
MLIALVNAKLTLKECLRTSSPLRML